MSRRFDIAKQIVAETCPERNLEWENVQLFAGIIQEKSYQKGDVILKEGDICENLMYIEKGMLRQHYVKHGKDMTEHIAYENGMVICIESYFCQKPTHLLVEALESCVLWNIPHDYIEDLADRNNEVSYLYRKIVENSLILSQVKADLLRFESAKERYLKLMQLYPEIVKRASLTHVSSYLQMSLETLSRVRANITGQK